MRIPFAPVTILPGSAPLAWSRACVDGCMKWLRSCLNSCSSWVIWVISFSLGYKTRRGLATPGSVLPASSADKTKSSADCTDAHRRAQTRTDGGALHRSPPVQNFSYITSTCRHCRKASTGCDICQWQPQIAEAKIFGFDKRREPLRATFAARARCLHAAEWNGRAGEFDAVDRHHGEVQPSDELEDRVDALCADIGWETVFGVVGQRHDFIDAGK